jgi:hypothetical protein
MKGFDLSLGSRGKIYGTRWRRNIRCNERKISCTSDLVNLARDLLDHAVVELRSLLLESLERNAVALIGFGRKMREGC